MSNKAVPKITSAVFCNSAIKDDSGKVDCRGVFTAFRVWAYPTSIRMWHALLTVYTLPAGTSTITVGISRGSGNTTTLASAEVHRGRSDIGSVVSIPLRYEFPANGLYNVHFTVTGSTTSLTVPLLLVKQPWPRLTNSEMEYLSQNPAVPHSVRLNAVCTKCSRLITLEENLTPDETLAEGVLPFPESGELVCKNCSHVLLLKDIQGQLRSAIKAGVVAAMRGGK